MKNRDFIISSLQSWDIPIGSNAIDIATTIARDNRVLYINSPLDIMTMYRNKPTAENQHRFDVIKKRKQPLRQINKNLWVLDFPFFLLSVNGLPDGMLFDAANRYNNRKMFGYVKQVADELGFRDIIHFIDNDIYRSLYAKEILSPALSVYYRRDNLQPFPYWKKHVGRLEPMLINKSELVVCNSQQLANYALQHNNHSYDVGQGVDLAAYNADIQYEMPAELAQIPGTRFGYIGDINSLRLDADLIYEMAKAKPAYSFVMIGKEDEIFRNHALHGLSNVYFTGSVAKHRVPEFMAALDVCMNPQLINEITIGNYPRKVDEYLAMGKPVIATQTAAMQMFLPHVYLCSTAAEYAAALDKSLAENSEEKRSERIRFAQSHSWANNVAAIYNRIQQSLN